MDGAKDRAWWWHRQGLDGQAIGKTARQALFDYGWCRSVGSVSPYLGLFARTGRNAGQVDAECAANEAYELPSARGCTYILPKEHFGIGLSLAQGTIDSLQMPIKYLGVTEQEVEDLKLAVLDALKDGPLTPAELRAPLGDKVRHLGEEGKKRGLTTTLPLATSWLQTHGKILRVPVGGGLVTQSYAYRLWTDCPAIPSRAEAQAKLAELFFRWAGPASFKAFQTFGSLTVKDAKAAIEEASIVALEDGRLMHPDDLDAYHAFQPVLTGEVKFVGSMDNLNMFRLNLADILDPEDAGQNVPRDKSFDAVGSLKELWSHMIVSDGRLIGVWEYDPEAQEVVSMTWVDRGDAVRKAQEETLAHIKGFLGDCRSFSLDSPKSREPRLEFIRNANKQLAGSRA